MFSKFRFTFFWGGAPTHAGPTEFEDKFEVIIRQLFISLTHWPKAVRYFENTLKPLKEIYSIFELTYYK